MKKWMGRMKRRIYKRLEANWDNFVFGVEAVTFGVSFIGLVFGGMILGVICSGS